jgi:hypothetical protein
MCQQRHHAKVFRHIYGIILSQVYRILYLDCNSRCRMMQVHITARVIAAYGLNVGTTSPVSLSANYKV